MGCGCGKKKAVQAPPSMGADQAARLAIARGSFTTYDVIGADGALVASFTNPVTARAEARRSNGTVVPRAGNSNTPAAPVNVNPT